ncbi:hypothetical protein BgiMline_030454, partial [Biomphalaria glabrata]
MTPGGGFFNGSNRLAQTSATIVIVGDVSRWPELCDILPGYPARTQHCKKESKSGA